MKEQHYKNHSQIVYGYYVFAGLPILILLVLAIRYLIRVGFAYNYNAALFVLIGWVLLVMLFRSRGFALKAQDRAIRAEEGLRHFILTGKRLDTRLSLRQIVALRFASDEEFPALAQKAIDENLSNDAIKRQIKSWRSDLHRV